MVKTQVQIPLMLWCPCLKLNLTVFFLNILKPEWLVVFLAYRIYIKFSKMTVDNFLEKNLFLDVY